MQRFPTLWCAGVLALSAAQAQAQMSFPTDFDATACTADVTPWFGGTVTAGGVVSPPDSALFTQNNANPENGVNTGPNICNFYQWGAQMFLWTTSPDGDGTVLDSAAFWNVLKEETKDKVKTRRLQDAGSDMPLRVGMRAQKGDDDIEEVGQAGGGGVLMSQDGSLVYYGVHVNDIYAAFLTGQKTGGLSEPTVYYPHTPEELQVVQDYITSVNLDAAQAPETMAMELKTSWVDAATVGDASQYITIPAVVPEYTANADNTEWTLVQGQEKTVTLALVGMHIVGTVQNHPEFVWATFEHITNAPDVAYWYTNSDQTDVQFGYDSSGDFLFLETGAAADPANVECMGVADQQSAGSITAAKSGTELTCEGGIVPSNTVRTRPWGSEPYGPGDVSKDVTEKQISDIILNNTRLLAVNASVRGQLGAGDVRANYVQTGGIWTTTPGYGQQAPIPNWKAPEETNMRGSLGLYNATMETYSQSFADNCFVCHSIDSKDKDSFGLSHIYGEIIHLPVK